jgi:hypothetical protein
MAQLVGVYPIQKYTSGVSVEYRDAVLALVSVTRSMCYSLYCVFLDLAYNDYLEAFENRPVTRIYTAALPPMRRSGSWA